MNEVNNSKEMPQQGDGQFVAGQQQQHQPNQTDYVKASNIQANQHPPVSSASQLTVSLQAEGRIDDYTTTTTAISSETRNSDQNATANTVTNAISESPNLDLQNLQLHQSPPHLPPIKPLLANDDNELIQNNSSSNLQQNPTQPIQPQISPQKAAVTKVKLADELNILDWFKTDIINHIAEKAKNSVDSVITTLDPGMKEYLYSGGNINIMVISDANRMVGPIRDAFQSVFGRATVLTARYDSSYAIHEYPIKIAIGFDEAKTVAHERINMLRLDTSNVPQNQVVVVIQPSIVNVSNQLIKSNSQDSTAEMTSPPDWFFTYCMLIEDPVLGASMSSFSQMIPLDDGTVNLAQDRAKYPDDFHGRHLGLSQPIHEIMASKLLDLSSFNEDDADFESTWLQEWAGLQESQVIHELSLTLANLYRRKWNDCTA